MSSIDHKPRLEEVYAALKMLYSTGSTDKHATEKASAYLAHIQQSVWAWELADTLLRQNKGKESNYFAATTIRNKIQREFRELPPSSHNDLRDSLLNHLTSFQKGESILLTQLCLALADLALQMAPWRSVVTDLVTRFSSNPESWNILLECLTVLPEEIGSRYLKLGAARRDEIQSLLQTNSTTVFSFLEFVSSNISAVTNPDFTHVHVFRCWGSWLVLGEFDAKLVSSGTIVQKLFEIVANNPVTHTCHEAACDAICSASYAMEDLHVNRELALQLVPRLRLLQKPLTDAINAEEIDIVNNITRIITEAGESLMSPLTKTPGKDLGDLTIVSLILTAIKYPDYTVAEVSFNFWFQLSEHILRNPEEGILEVYRPVFVDLLNTVVKLCALDETLETTSFEDEDFMEFREKCNDLMKDTVYILGVRTVVDLLYSELSPGTSSWVQVESVLFCSSCVIRMLSSNDTDIVYRFLNTVLQVPDSANYNLRVVCVKILGECAEWVVNNEQILHPVLQKLITELQDNTLSKHCVATLDKLCTAGRQILLPHVELLLSIVEQVVDVPNSTYTQFVENVVGVICYLPASEQASKITRIVNKALLGITNNPSNTINEIDAISAIFRGYKCDIAPTDHHPLQDVFVATWPHLARALETCAGSVNNVERICRCIRYALRSIGKRTPDILSPLADKLIVLYSVHPHSCILYLSSVMVDEFSSDKRFEEGLLGLFSAMGPKTFQILSAQHGLEQNPDTVDDFYRLCSRYMQHLGERVASSDIMTHLIDMATTCLTLQHRDAQCSAIKFIDTVLNRATVDKCSYCMAHIKRNGQLITNNIILGVSGALPPVLLTDLTILLHDMITQLGADARTWLRLSMSTIPIGSYVTQTHVEELYNNITAAAVSARDVMRHCKEFNQAFT